MVCEGSKKYVTEIFPGHLHIFSILNFRILLYVYLAQLTYISSSIAFYYFAHISLALDCCFLASPSFLLLHHHLLGAIFGV